jgi:hypothetical protein
MAQSSKMMSTTKIPKEKEHIKRKVAIVGFAPSWNLAPFDDQSFEIWGINELYVQAINKRFTMWFEIHDPESPSKKNEKHQKWLMETKLPLFMQKHYPKYPTSLPYPREEVKKMINDNFIVDKIGSPYSDYSNQITWMVLFAVMNKFDEIHLYGVDMAQQSEYAWQRASCQFAIGFAAGRGIKILIPKTSELCKYPRDYGFETDNVNRFMTKDRVKSLQQTTLGYQSQIYDMEHQFKIKNDEYEMLRKTGEAQLTKIGDELVKLDILVGKNKEMLNFMQTMPQDIETINNKKIDIIANIIKQNEAMTDSIKQLETQAKELKTKIENEGKINFINKQVLEASKANLEKQMHACQGAISECNYNLSNNRV